MSPVRVLLRLLAPVRSTCLAALLAATAAGAQQSVPNPRPDTHPSPPSQRAQQHPAPAHPPTHPPARTPAHPRTRAAPRPTPHPAPSPGPPAAAPEAPPPQPAPAAPPNKGSATGLPLPRFASLRTGDVNFRAGPGTRYPVEWVYRKRDLPVEIEREFDLWRLVRDPQNNRGWVHTATLTGRRTLLVTGAGEQVLRASARDDAAPVAKVEPGVIGRLRGCEAGSDWCQVQIKDYKGWMKRQAFWGTLPGEAVH
jgi:SH3-like domain-containing protein